MAMRLTTLCTGGVLLLSFVVSPVSAAETKVYTYDALGRLVLVVNDDHDSNSSNDKVRSYCYDENGNRVEVESDDDGAEAACVERG